jgi:hypothetical protein
VFKCNEAFLAHPGFRNWQMTGEGRKLRNKEVQMHTMYVISGFRRNVDICAVLGYYAALSGSSVPTFRDIVSGPFSRVKKSLFLDFLTLILGLLDP